MTALSDAITAAGTVASGEAAVVTARDAAKPGGSTPAAVQVQIAAIRVAGLALFAAGAPQVQAGLANAALNGWVGRKGFTGQTAGANPQIEGFSLAGVDTVCWALEGLPNPPVQPYT